MRFAYPGYVSTWASCPAAVNRMPPTGRVRGPTVATARCWRGGRWKSR